MAVGSTQPLTEMSTRNIWWGGGGCKGGRCVGLIALPPSCADDLEILRASISWNPEGQGLLPFYCVRYCPFSVAQLRNESTVDFPGVA
jgi:hypothetical protein